MVMGMPITFMQRFCRGCKSHKAVQGGRVFKTLGFRCRACKERLLHRVANKSSP